MLHLIKLEWLKMKNNTAFRVLSFIFVITFPLLLLAGKKIQGPEQMQAYLDSIYSFPTVYDYLGYIGNWLSFFFIGFMALLSVTNDYTNRTLRQNVITGLSRQDFIKSKIGFFAVVCAVATLYFILIGFGFGIFNTPKIFFSDFTDSIAVFGRFFLMCFGYSVFGLLVGTLLKKTGISLFIYIAYTMFIEPGIRWGLHSRIVDLIPRFHDTVGNKTMNFYPLNAFEDLVPNPLKDKADMIQNNDMPDITFFLSATEATITSIIYICLFIALIFYVLKRRDL